METENNAYFTDEKNIIVADENSTTVTDRIYTNATVDFVNISRGTDDWVAPGFDGSLINIVIAIALTVLVAVTIFGNLLVILSFVFERRLWQPFNLFILNLAVTDIIIGITAMTLCSFNTILGYWPFGVYLCGVWIYFDFAMTFASVFTLVAISIDRFCCVTWPIHFKAQNHNKRTVVIIGIIWFCVVAIWTPPFIKDQLNNRKPHLCIWDPAYNKVMVIFIDVIGHYIPCAIMLVCYIKVFVVMRRRQAAAVELGNVQFTHPRTQVKITDIAKAVQMKAQSEGSPSTSGRSSPTSNNVSDHSSSGFSTHSESVDQETTTVKKDFRPYRQFKREHRIFITLSYTLMIYMICWFPFYVTFDVSAVYPNLVPDELYMVFFWITYLNSTLNPFIYAYTNKEFRSAFKTVQDRLFFCKRQAQ